MRRVVFAVLSACVLVSLGVVTGPAKAGDYYEDGYRHRNSDNVWYSSNCCYKKVVRHERSVHYRRVDEERSYDRQSYYDRPYRNYDRPYRRSYSYDTPRRYEDDSYVARRYVNSGNSGYNGYSDYNRYNGYASYADSCFRRKVPLADDNGGWVWGTKTNCY